MLKAMSKKRFLSFLSKEALVLLLLLKLRTFQDVGLGVKSEERRLLSEESNASSDVIDGRNALAD
jgi:hypothetical protein